MLSRATSASSGLPVRCQRSGLDDLDGGRRRCVRHEGDDFDDGAPGTCAECLAGSRPEDPHRVVRLSCQRIVLRGRQPRGWLTAPRDGVMHRPDLVGRCRLLELVLEELPEQRMHARTDRRVGAVSQQPQGPSILEVSRHRLHVRCLGGGRESRCHQGWRDEVDDRSVDQDRVASWVTCASALPPQGSRRSAPWCHSGPR